MEDKMKEAEVTKRPPIKTMNDLIKRGLLEQVQAIHKPYPQYDKILTHENTSLWQAVRTSSRRGMQWFAKDEFLLSYGQPEYRTDIGAAGEFVTVYSFTSRAFCLVPIGYAKRAQ